MEHEELIRLFSGKVRRIMERATLDMANIYEIRLRVHSPLLLVYAGEEFFVTEEGALSTEAEKGYQIQAEDVRETMEYIGNYSLYAYEEELRQGFLTVQGGHRVGIAGKAVLENEKVRGIRHISCINVRVAHQQKGCADKVIPYLMKQGSFCHTLIVSAPRCGKTTLLRDIIRQISDGTKDRPGLTVGVVDERSEIAGCYLGVAQNDVGIRTDVLDCCPKAEGMMMLIRSMSPEVVAVDEIGTSEDIHAIEYAMQCGCKLIASVHGLDMEEASRKPVLGELIRRRMFERYVVLGNGRRPGEIRGIYDERGSVLCRDW